MTTVKSREEWDHEIISQFEHYFSNQNLRKDRFLRELISRNAEQYVSIVIMAESPKIKAMNQELDDIISALRQSSKLQVGLDGKHVRRISPLPEKAPDTEQKRILDPAVQKEKRTIFCGNLPPDCGVDGISALFSRFGKIANIALCDSKANTDPSSWQLQPPTAVATTTTAMAASTTPSANTSGADAAGTSQTTPSSNPSPNPTSALIEFETRNHAKKAVVSITAYNKKLKARKKSLDGSDSAIPSLPPQSHSPSSQLSQPTGWGPGHGAALEAIVEAEPDSPREQRSSPTTVTPPSGDESIAKPSKDVAEDDDDEEDDAEDDDDDEIVPSLLEPASGDSSSAKSPSVSTSASPSPSPSPSPFTSPPHPSTTSSTATTPTSGAPVSAAAAAAAIAAAVAAAKKQLDESYAGLWVMPKALFMKRLSKTSKEKKRQNPPCPGERPQEQLKI